jgi:hypothetical protein
LLSAHIAHRDRLDLNQPGLHLGELGGHVHRLAVGHLRVLLRQGTFEERQIALLRGGVESPPDLAP